MSSTQSFREMVREQTAAVHLALEALPLMRAVSDGSPTETQFHDYLVSQLQLHTPLEASLRTWVSKDCAAVRLRKTAWLQTDLDAFGNETQYEPGAPATAVPITSAAEAMGALYVLEGATLGLQVLRKRLDASGSRFAGASRFLQGYGATTGSNWRSFLETLDGMREGAWPAALASACLTFGAFHDCFAAPRASTGARGERSRHASGRIAGAS